MIGQTISHYSILEKIGGGGMGVVYKARDVKLERLVALKFLPPHLDANADEKRRFIQEAQAASALDHPNICTIYEIDETANGQLFIAMAYYAGETLKKTVTNNQLSANSAIEIAVQIAQGLAKAHEHAIVHRDIKPANIIVTKDGVVKIIDFGLAKFVGRHSLTKTGATMGTMAYMAPEQVSGGIVGQTTDIWSLGVVMYEMLTGQLPFPGENEQAVMYAILCKAPQPLPALPEELTSIIQRSLEKAVEQRFQSAHDILQRLQAFREGTKTIAISATTREKPAPHSQKIRTAVVALIVLLTIAALIPYRYFIRQQQALSLLPQIEHLTAAEKYFEAFTLARQAGKYLKNDSTLQRLQLIISDKLTIVSQPAGARAYLTRFTPEDSAAREFIGVTPIYAFRLPRVDHKLDLEKAGFVSVERLIATKINREEFLSRAIKIEVPLVENGKAPDNMVFVPGGTYQLVAWGAPPTAEVHLADYFIDRFEVSNADYKTFITAGGYLNRSYWKQPFYQNGRAISWEQAMQQFTDRTGLPGPRSWVNQEFPEGKSDYPVTDITWYEAAAYAEFIGKKLPTIFQWEKAARAGMLIHVEGVVLPWGLVNGKESIVHRANFKGKSTTSVRSYTFGLSPFGCYNMAGNVKEWCLNEAPNGYFTAGGSWQDPSYLFANYGIFPSFYSSNALGFRCVRAASDTAIEQSAMKINVERRTPSYTPVDAATFRSFLSFYHYDTRPLQAELLETKETPDWTRQKVSFAGRPDERIIAYFYLPKHAAPPYQVLQLFPNGSIFQGASAAEIAESILAPQIKSGRAVLATVPQGGHERESENLELWPKANSVKYRERAMQLVIEFRLGVDYLASRSDIAMDKLALVGMSWGASEAALITTAVETRYRAVIFIAGAIRLFDVQKLPEVNPINFVPHINVPKLMIHGQYDEVFPYETHALPLYHLLREKKQLALLEAGHTPPLELQTPIINKWLDEIFGPVQFKP